MGGKDNDLLFGDGDGDIVWGNLGNDTCDGGGTAPTRSGAARATTASPAARATISCQATGGTTRSPAARCADLFHGSQDAGLDRVVDFSLAQGDRVMLDPGTTYTLSQVGADTVIDMGGGHQMVLVGVTLSTLTPGWIFGA